MAKKIIGEFTATIHNNPTGSARIIVPSFWLKELKINAGDSVRMAILKEEEK